jgi:glutaredoxin
MSKKTKKRGSKAGLIIGIIVVIVIIGGMYFVITSGGSKYSQESVDEFAKCLTDNGAVMYGAFWCPHCARTKKNFGSSFRFIEYVECDPRGDDEQSEMCIEKGIDNYDTWEFIDGSRVIGEPSFEELSGSTGCPMPTE